MQPTIETIKVGDYIKVKDGLIAPDSEEQLMDGWHGKITAINKKENLVTIEWDTKTLLDTPYKYLHEIISTGHDHELMFLLITDIELANERKSSEEEEGRLEGKLFWIDFYEDEAKDLKYAELFSKVNMLNIYDTLGKWQEYLSKNFKFPFEVEVVDSERGGMRIGSKIKLLGLADDYDDMRGLFAIGKHQGGTITYPICNLEATNEDSANYELLEDYVIWFANQ